MPRWTVSFEASAVVSVEAQTPDQARQAAERTLKAIGIDSLISEVTHCSVDISVMKDE